MVDYNACALQERQKQQIVKAAHVGHGKGQVKTRSVVDSLLPGKGARVAEHAANSMGEPLGLGCGPRGVDDHQQIVGGDVLERMKRSRRCKRGQIDRGRRRARRRILCGRKRDGGAAGRRGGGDAENRALAAGSPFGGHPIQG